MKVLIVGGGSSLALVLRSIMPPGVEVFTGGRVGCDIDLDLALSPEELAVPTVDVVINCAAHFGGNEPEQIFSAESVNVLGVMRLAQACHQSKVKHFISVSSIFATLGERSPFFNIYALSKRHSDELLRLYCAQVGLPLSILRPSQFYGVGERYRRHQPLIYALMDKAQRGEDIVINGSNDALRNFLYVDDVAEVILRVAVNNVLGSYNCCFTSNVRLSEVAETASALFGGRSEVHFDPRKPDIPSNGFKADERLFRAIEFWPKISLKEGMSRVAMEPEERAR